MSGENTSVASSGTPVGGIAAPTTVAATIAGPSVSVQSHGALGNGIANDTAAFQRALDSGATTVLIPDGTYMIDATVGLNVKSNQTIQLSTNTILKAIPNAARVYTLLRLGNVSNVEINGGQIVGDRAVHLGTAGEHGMGIAVGAGANDIRIRNIKVSDFWGDGIYVGGSNTRPARNVLFENVTCENNRRQGLSITSAEYVTVRNSVFRNTRGTAPQSGLDIEPNSGAHVSHVLIDNNQFLDNAGYGILVAAQAGLYVDDVLMKDNTFSGNNIRVGVSNTATATNIRLEIRPGQTTLDPYEFNGCFGLSQIKIPDSVTSISTNAFYNCYWLTTVNIPASVASIGSNAFNNCMRLNAAYFYGNAPTVGPNPFKQTAPGFTAYFLADKLGFTTPTWRGYPSANFHSPT